VALTPSDHGELADLSLRMGASAVLPGDSDPTRTAAALQRALRDPASRPNPCPLNDSLRGRAARSHLLASQILQGLTLNPAEGFDPLLVEDDANEALFFRRALRKLGLCRRLPIVGSADEAIQYLSARGDFSDRRRYPQPSLVLLDFHLGNETGEKVLRWIRGSPEHSKLPVVLLSACRNEADIGRMRVLGLNAHVEKPTTPEELDATVKLILDFWQMWRAQGGDPG
jgi:CheY-like chemotaxis protein